MFGCGDANMARVHRRKAAQKKMAASGAAKAGNSGIVVPPREKANKNSALKGHWRSLGESNPSFKIENLVS